jgi:DNA-3-methyladenine glycosylase
MNPEQSHKKLERQFYTRELLTVAKELLGKILVKNDGKIKLSGKIVEVEAYGGSFDEAAHTYGGKTKRNEIMFGIGGFLYVYFTYGTHFCCNVVTGKEGDGTAILIRAIQPVNGIKRMTYNRFGRDLIIEKEKYNLTNGPGKICQSLSITKKHYGIDLTGDKIFLLDQTILNDDQIVFSKRIGIKKSIDLLWRLYLKDNPFVSRK